MYFKIEEEVLERIEKLTMTDYEAKLGYLPAESLTSIIDDLLLEIDSLEEKIEDLERDIENNYELKNANPYEEYGVSERDFY
jgi:hypothetical protein